MRLLAAALVVIGAIAAVGASASAAPRAGATFPGRNGLIVFVNNRAPSSRADMDNDLYTIGADGRRLKALTSNRSNELSPKWSPGGKRIAFSRYGRDMARCMDCGTYAIHVMRADGTGAGRITSASGVSDHFPSWSPSGRRIAFVRQSALPRGYLTGQVFVVNVDGKRLRRIVAERGEYANLTWSPDGTSFAFLRQQHLYVMRADGSAVRQLFASYPWVTGFAWSPDGRRLAAAHDYPEPGIDVVNADGTGQAVLVPDVRAADLAWSPDGRKLALRTQGFRIAVADIASGRVRVLDTGAGEGVDSQPDWQPLP